MKKTIKNILFIIWILISLKIISLTIGNVIGIFFSLLMKFINLVLPVEFVWFYVETHYINLLKPTFPEPLSPILLVLRSTTDQVLFFFLCSTWILYFTSENNYNKFKTIDKQTIVLLCFILLIYMWGNYDIFLHSFIKEPISVLKDTLYLKILRLLIFCIFILNCIIVLNIFLGKNWSLFKKCWVSIFILGINFYSCVLVDLLIIWKEGLLYQYLNNSTDLVDTSFIMENFLQTLYASYGLSISWCNPTLDTPAEHCALLRQRMEDLCFIPNTVNKIPLYSRNIPLTVGGQFAYPLTDYSTKCMEYRVALEQCMQLHSQGIQRYLEAQHMLKAAPKPYVGGQVIDTWSVYMKK